MNQKRMHRRSSKPWRHEIYWFRYDHFTCQNAGRAKIYVCLPRTSPHWRTTTTIFHPPRITRILPPYPYNTCAYYDFMFCSFVRISFSFPAWAAFWCESSLSTNVFSFVRRFFHLDAHTAVHNYTYENRDP